MPGGGTELHLSSRFPCPNSRARITASYTRGQVAKVLQVPRTASVRFESGH